MTILSIAYEHSNIMLFAVFVVVLLVLRGLYGKVFGVRAKIFYTVFLPFVLALLPAMLLRKSAFDEVLSDIQVTTEAIKRQSGGKPNVADVASRIADDLYGRSESFPKVVGKDLYEKFVRIVAFRWDQFQQKPPVVIDSNGMRVDGIAAFIQLSKGDFFRNSVIQFCIILTLTLYFPALYLSMFIRAQYKKIEEESESGKDATGNLIHDTFSKFIWYKRNADVVKSMEGDGFPMWSAFFFGLLIAFASLFVLSPAGLRSSLLREYIALEGPPSEPSSPFWFQGLEAAPPLTLGLAGFLLYAILLFYRRFTMQDLNQLLFASLCCRGMTVALLSLMISALDSSTLETELKPLLFAVGMFPRSGISFISKLAKISAEKVTKESTIGMGFIPEIDQSMEDTISDFGIYSLHDLACHEAGKTLRCVGFDPLMMVRAIDKAIFVHEIDIPKEKPEDMLTRKLEQIGIFTATAFIEYLESASDDAQKQSRIAAIKKVTALEDVTPVIKALTDNPNRKQIAEWKKQFKFS